mgnify:FL=1
MSNNAVHMCMRFYRNQNGIPPLWRMLLLTGISGALETLPILLALPLIRSIYLDLPSVNLQGFTLSFTIYTVALVGLLIIRFAVGSWSQFQNAKARITLLDRINTIPKGTIDKPERIALNQCVQSINFLLNGWAQFIPGLFFAGLGVYFAPTFGAVTLAILAPWILVIRRIKSIQDKKHRLVPKLESELDKSDRKLWRIRRISASLWDSINKNLREFVVISTLIVSLFINHTLFTSSTTVSIIVIILYLRGLQQVYTGYIMSQQIVALKESLSLKHTVLLK